MAQHYQPSRPAGLAHDAPLPRPARFQLRTVLLWTLVVILVGTGTSLTALAIGLETGAQGLLVGTVLAAVPVLPVVGAFLWLDRYEAEPPSLLITAFAWGAGVATFGSLVVNTASTAAIEAAGGDVNVTAVLVAPVVEEAFKASAVLLILVLRRREFDGVVDGIVYAGMAGIGFAFVENVLYLGRALGEAGGTGAAFVFILRCVVSPFAHPLFTVATGAAIGWAVQTRVAAVRWLAPPLGYLVAVLLHGTWNLSATSGLAGFLGAYVAFQVPVFVLAAALAVAATAREGRLIRQQLSGYAAAGWLSSAEVLMLGSVSARRDARRWARRTGGVVAHRSMRDFQELATELAFLRQRMQRGRGAPGAREQEWAMLAALSATRAGFLPRWAPGVRAG